MFAAIVTGPNQTPKYGEFKAPTPQPGCEVVTVEAAALTHLTRGRAAGDHYSARNAYPMVVGTDGVGVTPTGQRVLFLMPEAPFGAMAAQTLIRNNRCVPVPDGLSSKLAAALGNPGTSAMVALTRRAHLQKGETVLVNGATGSAGRMAVQLARYLGAARVIAVGRDAATLKSLPADATVNLTDNPEAALREHFLKGVDVVIDYLGGSILEMTLTVAAKARVERPLRYVATGGMAGSEITIRDGMLRAIPVTLMGNGIGSVPEAQMAQVIGEMLRAAIPAELSLPVRALPLDQVEAAWTLNTGKERVVFVP